ncbi:unnamed protein product [Adineta steineri]|uniref:Uncharacterized protein n=1 Tax=Adineta steineri TaxID=433720 RepID=A0A814DY82_9BILA|nr:unnamed protein product [Adineta steineri]
MGCGSTKAASDNEKNAVENWRQKREQKRSKNVNTDNEEISISPFKIEPIRKPAEIKKPINEPIRQPIHSVPSPPIEKIKSKSPSPMRFKGPAKIHEIYIEKPIEIRGFGFKLDGGRSQNRPIIISAIEEGSPADKAGLCIDDEVISMNNENIENLTFDQVRKILKERNLRGSIKMIVKTYEDTIDDNSQTVTNGFTTDHSRTPSPPKHISTTTISPNISVPKTNSTPNNLSPVYTFLPYTPSDSIKVNTVQQPIPTSPINILTPKPYRSTASINLDPQNNHDSDLTFSRKELLTLMVIIYKQFHTTLNQAPRQPHVDDNAWIRNNQRKTPNGHSNGRRSAPLAPHQQELQINRQPMSNYHEHHSRYEQQRNFESSPNKPNRTRSAGRTLNNERVLSVSGKLHCSRCNEELGHGSAMVIESLKLYYHIECFRCCVCNVPLTSSPEGIDVRIRNNRLHCQNCFSDENGK